MIKRDIGVFTMIIIALGLTTLKFSGHLTLKFFDIHYTDNGQRFDEGKIGASARLAESVKGPTLIKGSPSGPLGSV